MVCFILLDTVFNHLLELMTTDGGYMLFVSPDLEEVIET